MYGLRQSWFAAQMARFTARGAPAGAAACPKRRRARVPGTVGPEAGKMFAFADDTIAAKTAAPTRILGLRGYTTVFGACLMPQELALPREKSTWARFVKTFSRGLLGRCCGMPYAFKISSAGHNYPADGKEYAPTRFSRSALNPGRKPFSFVRDRRPCLSRRASQSNYERFAARRAPQSIDLDEYRVRHNCFGRRTCLRVLLF